MKKAKTTIALKKYEAMVTVYKRREEEFAVRIHHAEQAQVQLRLDYDKLHNVAQKFAEQKERDAETIAKLTRMLEAK